MGLVRPRSFVYGAPTNQAAYELLLPQSQYAATWPNQEAKVSALDALFPKESTGDLFIGRVDNHWLAYHPQQNRDVPANGELELKYNGCGSLGLVFSPHTFGVINEEADSITLYLNNYRTDKEPLWQQYPSVFNSTTLQNDVLPAFVESPTDTRLRETRIVLKGCEGEPSFTLTDTGAHQPSQLTHEYGSDAMTFVLEHNGPVVIAIQATGSASGRFTGTVPRAGT